MEGIQKKIAVLNDLSGYILPNLTYLFNPFYVLKRMDS